MDATSSGGTRTTVAVSAALTTAVLPVFLIGASSDAITAELGISETAIGGAVTVLFATVGLAAGPVGRLTERVGAVAALRTGLLLSGLATAAIGLLARSWWQLALPLAVVGVAIGLVDTGGARAFADRITSGRQGTAFGLKEASVPSASLLAGLALPTLAVWLDWRASFLAAPVLAAVVALVVPRSTPAPTHEPTAHTQAAARGEVTPTVAAAPSAPGGGEADARARAGVVRLAIAVGLGAGAATAAATFLVPASTARGLSTNAAGALLVVASIASIAMRIGTGRWADRQRSVPTRAIAVMLAAGGLGAAVLATPVPAVVAALAATVVLGAGWGWTGLAFLAAVRARPSAPAVAAGAVLTGLGVGGAGGPLAFGALASTASYTVAWTATAAALLASSALAASAVPRAAAASRTATPTP